MVLCHRHEPGHLPASTSGGLKTRIPQGRTGLTHLEGMGLSPVSLKSSSEGILLPISSKKRLLEGTEFS